MPTDLGSGGGCVRAPPEVQLPVVEQREQVTPGEQQHRLRGGQADERLTDGLQVVETLRDQPHGAAGALAERA